MIILAGVCLVGCTGGHRAAWTYAVASGIAAGDRPSIAPAASRVASLPASGAPASLAASPETSGPASPSPAAVRVIELEETGQLRIVHDGQQVTDIPVTPGETVRFVITNSAGFDHDFFIGTDEQLAGNRVTGLPGLPTGSASDPREFEWTVPADITGLRFGCTLRGHYPLMNGTFSAR